MEAAGLRRAATTSRSTRTPTRRLQRRTGSLSRNSKQVAYSPHDAARGLNTPYVWRVRRVDATGSKGAWSLGLFEVTGQRSRARGARRPGRTSSAARHAVHLEGRPRRDVVPVRATEQRARPRSTRPSRRPAWRGHRPARIPNGTWAVAGHGSTTSAEPPMRELLADLLRRRPVAPAWSSRPTRTASRTANFVAKFSEPVRNVNRTTMKLYVKGRSTPDRQGDAQLRRQDGDAEPGHEPSCRQDLHGQARTAIRDGAGNRLAATSLERYGQVAFGHELARPPRLGRIRAADLLDHASAGPALPGPQPDRMSRPRRLQRPPRHLADGRDERGPLRDQPVVHPAAGLRPARRRGVHGARGGTQRRVPPARAAGARPGHLEVPARLPLGRRGTGPLGVPRPAR